VDAFDVIDTRALTAAAIIAPFVLAIVEAAKAGLKFDTRYAGLVALAVGVVLSLLLFDSTLRLQIFSGLVAGLTASGFYSGGKALVEGS
jgi:hypothetical protein